MSLPHNPTTKAVAHLWEAVRLLEEAVATPEVFDDLGRLVRPVSAIGKIAKATELLIPTHR